MYYSFSTWPTTAARADSYEVGFQFTVTTNITVHQLGRLYVAGNTLNHVVNIWDTADSSLVVSGTVLAASSSDGNNFKWVTITDTPLVTTKTYRISISESGADTWTNKAEWTPALTAQFNASFFSVYGTYESYPANLDQEFCTYSTPAMAYTIDSEATNYSRGDVTPLPSDDADLETIISDRTNISSINSIYIDQTASGQYAIFLFKDTVTGASADFTWYGQSNLAPQDSIVKMQVYQRTGTGAPQWVDLDTDNATLVNVDFYLNGTLSSGTTPTIAECKDGSNIIATRVWQQAT